SIGVFEDCSESILAGIADTQHEFVAMTPVLVPGHREKFCITIPCREGNTTMFLKAKFPMHSNAFNFHAAYRKLQKDIERYAEPWRNALQRALVWDMHRDSVINEICASRVAKERYQLQFGEELPIERSIGFVADRKGHKWGIFEFFDDILRLEEFSRREQVAIRARRRELVARITHRLPEIGIRSGDVMDEKNILIRGIPRDIHSLYFTIVDTEDWIQM
ncbi:MAG: hypothetical protein WCW78_03875, partial [Candidatus Paceibacterota bacterium]